MLFFYGAFVIAALFYIVKRFVYKQNLFFYPVKHAWIYVAAIVFEHFFVFNGSNLPFEMNVLYYKAAIVLTMFACAVFFVLNLAHFPFFILFVGTLLNLIAILANGGFMPVHPFWATRIYGYAMDMHYVVDTKSIILHNANLYLLTDAIFINFFNSYNIAISIGDALIFIGIIFLFSGRTKNDATY
ncbi:MAG: DUF5317 family protein [Candidatus Aenigmatarchaeota archaeon]